MALPENKPNTIDDRIRLNAIFERMRQITNDKEINNNLQDRNYMQLAVEMSELARLGHEANGILFGFHLRINTHVFEEVDAELAANELKLKTMPKVALTLEEETKIILDNQAKIDEREP